MKVNFGFKTVDREEKQNLVNDVFTTVATKYDLMNDLMSFGRQTWPHMLARIMLGEQIYRAQQIIVNSPYHREG